VLLPLGLTDVLTDIVFLHNKCFLLTSGHWQEHNNPELEVHLQPEAYFTISTPLANVVDEGKCVHLIALFSFPFLNITPSQAQGKYQMQP
jgi:hypothetical protein